SALRAVLRGTPVVEASEEFHIERSRPHGHVQAEKQAMKQLGQTELIASKPSVERDRVLAMVAQRIIRPGSKLEMTALFEDTSLAQEFGVEQASEDDLYAAMDWLLDHQPIIQKKLAKRHLAEGSLVFYDVSSSTYYGRHCSLAKRGHNRDGIPFPCIVYGLLTNREGCPVALRVYPGNTADPVNVADQLGLLKKEFGLGQVVLVGDRGMLTAPQIEKIRVQDGFGWISCLRSSDIRRLMEQEDPSKAPLFSSRHLAEISHPDFPGERLIACYNPLLAQDRERTRKELVAATEKLLERLAKEVERRRKIPLTSAQIGLKAGRVINRYKVAKHFSLVIEEGHFSWSLKEEQILREKKLDGLYVVRTNEPLESLSSQDAVRAYKRLGNVEKAFRTLKGLDLRIRPIYHRFENRVCAHFFLGLQAYYVEWHMRQALSSLLYAEDDLEAARSARDPVAQAKPSPTASQKKLTKSSAEGWTLRRWDGLLQYLGTLTRNICRIGSGKQAVRFTRHTEPTDEQRHVFELIDKKIRGESYR
ncbi:MAG TPA: IS1634 family transposase, partial [Candidatus Syntrophosphaera sp.]|nr:IS1634 family transposase [Candidatus Syntrophosphaera sp.]